MTSLRVIHLLAAAVWTGGMITLAVLVVALRKAGASRESLRVAARAFAKLSWTAAAIAVLTGLLQVWLRGIPWGYAPLQWKLTIVSIAVALSAFHHVTARRATPAARGIVQLLILVASIAIYAAAAQLHLS